MKSFLELVEETKQGEKHHVMAFGRMNPPTTGHMKVIDKVKEIADKHNAEHSVVTSHSQDKSKNPLSASQKLNHLHRYSPSTHFVASTKEHPTFLHHAAELHKKGVTHLHMVAGSDRVSEYKKKLAQYNGTHKGALYNFKKIRVHSAGHRDPDSEHGTEGMSGTKMRDAASEKRFHDVKDKTGKVVKPGFRSGVPSHVSDEHAQKLMHDTRKGMGLHEDVNRGLFKAIFVTGGPGSGKDIVIREAIAEGRIVEFNFTQACDVLNDKYKLATKSMNPRFEAVRNRGPLIINGPADDLEKISHIKEELEELGYNTMMIFVSTSNETSQERNSLLSRMMVESVRNDKWQKSQENIAQFTKLYNNLVTFDNTGDLESKKQDIHELYNQTKNFLDNNILNEISMDWLNKNNKLNRGNNSLIGEGNVKGNSKSIQGKTVGRYNPFFQRAKGPADIKPDNSGSLVGDRDQIKGDTGPRKNTGVTSSVTGGGWSGAYEEAQPTITKRPEPKESNFEKDNDKEKVKKRGNTSLSAGRVARPAGVTPEYDSRDAGQGAAAGAGLGNQTYSESEEYSNASQNGTAMLGAKLEPNPLAEKKKKKMTFREYNGFQNDVDVPPTSGVGGTLGGSDNKEGMDTYKDPNRNIGFEIKKKKKKGAI
jgi:cytidyltransferase-like protein